MSKEFDRLRTYIQSIDPQILEVFFHDSSVSDDLMYILRLVFGESIIKTWKTFYSKKVQIKALKQLEDGIYDDDIKNGFSSIVQDVKDATKEYNLNKQQIDKEFDEVENWEQYEKELGTKREADVDDVLGAYAFPMSRNAAAERRDSRNKLPSEPNTAVEKELLRAIESHLLDSGNIPAELSDEIIKILKSGIYSNIFVRCEPGTTIYRGMSVDRKWLQNAIGDKFATATGVYEGSMKFKPFERKHSTSWTTNKDITNRFMTDFTGTKVSVLLTCEVTDDMYALDCYELYRELPKIKGLISEMEIICFGNVPCTSVQWKSHR